jgi:hypothetical protein
MAACLSRFKNDPPQMKNLADVVGVRACRKDIYLGPQSLQIKTTLAQTSITYAQHVPSVIFSNLKNRLASRLAINTSQSTAIAVRANIGISAF